MLIRNAWHGEVINVTEVSVGLWRCLSTFVYSFEQTIVVQLAITFFVHVASLAPPPPLLKN